MRISLDALMVLDAIDRRGSFAAAANELHRVPSAITYTIQKLEQDLDVQLFDRGGHRAKLTQAGIELLTEGRTLLEAATALEARVKRVATGWEAELKIAIGDLIPIDYVLDLIGEFDTMGSDTRIRLVHESYGGVWDALVSGRADLAIGAPDFGPSNGFRWRKLAEVEFVFVAAPWHPLVSETQPIPTTVVRKHRSISVSDSSRNLPPRTSGVASGQITLSVPTHEAKLAAQLAGLGVGFLPRRMAAPFIASGELVQLEVEEPKSTALLNTAWPTKQRGNGLKWFVDRLSDPEVQARFA
ncbi:LysR family transcriptional regulator [Parachitinimonas caeni]|uniref:LysR family transcriptional regulator n=1 Tax=Parachitinimonas caeni TaxID=3031301 RepID=A0ABT7DV39_9NEIS|nr:LysR family transcriptional regulator [Parachitinimonas caeni]MDK2123936.1 LysR family transcriptional regulator [Parachitinimonas caeni]